MTQDVMIDYTNWKDVRRKRVIRPLRLVFCASFYHHTQWMIEAEDLEDNRTVKHFPLANIHSWMPVA